MQKITLRISGLDPEAEEAAVRDLLILLNQYRPGPRVFFYAEGDPDLSGLFNGPSLSAWEARPGQTSTKKEV
jgi:hypothetical protein